MLYAYFSPSLSLPFTYSKMYLIPISTKKFKFLKVQGTGNVQFLYLNTYLRSYRFLLWLLFNSDRSGTSFNPHERISLPPSSPSLSIFSFRYSKCNNKEPFFRHYAIPHIGFFWANRLLFMEKRRAIYTKPPVYTPYFCHCKHSTPSRI